MKNQIIIGNNIMAKINKLINLEKFSKIAILTDINVARHWLMPIKKSLKQKTWEIIIKPGEKEKNIDTVKKILEQMFELGLDRQSLLLNLGGGVICDMGGFAASIFMRGIDFINIPTTLLSQVDASVGGKVGIDFNEIKNAIGVFKQPSAVIIDVATLKSLPKREFLSAFGEIIKHAVISGREYFDLVTSKKPEEFNQNELIRIVKGSIRIKSDIVKKDPEEKNLRKILNFGHTIGHAIESLSWKTDKPLLHGEAVAIGMVFESNLASSKWSTCTAELIKKAVSKAGLPTKIKGVKSEDIIKVILSDKKNFKGKLLFSLPEKIGKIVPNIKISQEIIKNLLQTQMSS